MAQEYLPALSNIRLADLMKEHNISQPELAKELGCSKSTINRFISGAKGRCNVGQRFGYGRSHAGSTGTAAERSVGNLAVRTGKRP